MSYETFLKNQKSIISDCDLKDIPSKVNYPETFTDRSDAVMLTDVETNEYIQKAIKEATAQIEKDGKGYYSIGTGDTQVKVTFAKSKDEGEIKNVMCVTVYKKFSEMTFINVKTNE